MRSRALQIITTVVAVVLASAASYAFAGTHAPRTTTVASVAVIDACVNNKTHAIYRETTCPKGYSKLTWNTKGPAGPAGAAGKNGVNGTNGLNGSNGAAATVSVGTVQTGAAGSSAAVTNAGTSSAARLNFTIPAGATGATGPGISSVDATTLSAGSSATASLTGSGSTQALHLGIPTGATGATGVAPFSAPTTWSDTGNYCKATSTTPGSTVTFDGSTYLYTAASCGAGNEINAEDQEVVNPADWETLAQAGQNGTANDWAFFDPGYAGTTMGTAGVIQYDPNTGEPEIANMPTIPGQYQITMGGCTASSPAGPAISVTPEQLTSDSPNDTGLGDTIVSASVNTVTDTIDGGIEFDVDTSAYNGSTSKWSLVEVPFSVTINC